MTVRADTKNGLVISTKPSVKEFPTLKEFYDGMEESIFPTFDSFKHHVEYFVSKFTVDDLAVFLDALFTYDIALVGNYTNRLGDLIEDINFDEYAKVIKNSFESISKQGEN